MLLSILAGMTVLAVVLLAVPLMRRPPATIHRRDADLRIYRDQLTEVETERARGLIAEREAEAARREVERRLLRAFDAAPASSDAKAADEAAARAERRRRIIAVVLLALAVPVTAGLVYARLGAAGAIGALPWEPSLAQRQAAEFQGLVQQLEQKVHAEPNRAEGWALLGRMYALERRYDEAAEAFERAAGLQTDNGALYVAAAEVRAMAADGTVTPAANALLDKALARDPKNPGALYYKAIRQWQQGHQRAAYDAWLALIREAPKDAPWLPQVLARAREAAAALKLPPPDVTPSEYGSASSGTAAGPSAADIADAAKMSPEQRDAMIRNMVDSLAARLEANPNDLVGWMRLGRAYAVLGEATKSVAAFEHARSLAPNNPDVLTGLAHARAAAGDRQGALSALGEARAQLDADDPRRDQIDQTMRAYQTNAAPTESKDLPGRAGPAEGR